jgi:predicted ABC-type ATPase
MPEIHVIAGANGSGKSTISKSIVKQINIPMIDPDAIAREINPANPAQASIQAGKTAISLTQIYINKPVSFGVETTLSGRNYLKLMKFLKEAKWTVNLIYIGIDNPETNIRRVRERVDRGGHNVPTDDICRRYERSLDNLAKAIVIADSVVIYDNSERQFSLIETIENGVVSTYAQEYPSWYNPIKT